MTAVFVHVASGQTTLRKTFFRKLNNKTNRSFEDTHTHTNLGNANSIRQTLINLIKKEIISEHSQTVCVCARSYTCQTGKQAHLESDYGSVGVFWLSFSDKGQL